MKEITLTVTDAARGFSDLINRVRYRGESATLTKNGRVVARVVPVVRGALTGAELAKRWKWGSHLAPRKQTRSPATSRKVTIFSSLTSRHGIDSRHVGVDFSRKAEI